MSQFIGRFNAIYESCGNGASGHAVELGRLRGLGHDKTLLIVDITYTLGTIGTGTGKDDTKGFIALVQGQGFEENVDGQVQLVPRRLVVELQHGVADSQVFLWRDEVDTPPKNFHALPGHMDRHGGVMGQQFAHQAFIIRRKMLDDHKGMREARGYMVKKFAQRFKTTRRGAYADDEKGFISFPGGFHDLLAHRAAI